MRYFIVFANFRGINKWGCPENGNLNATIYINGGFPNMSKLTKFIHNDLLNNKGFQEAEIALTNILELSKQDYLDFTGNKE